MVVYCVLSETHYTVQRLICDDFEVLVEAKLIRQTHCPKMPILYNIILLLSITQLLGTVNPKPIILFTSIAIAIALHYIIIV